VLQTLILAAALFVTVNFVLTAVANGTSGQAGAGVGWEPPPTSRSPPHQPPAKRC